MTTIKTIQDFKANIEPGTSFWYLVYESNSPTAVEKATVKEYINDDEISLETGFFADFGITPKIQGFLSHTPVYLRRDAALKKLETLRSKK